MTFEEFQLTRTFVEDMSATPVGHAAGLDPGTNGVVYAHGAVYIEDHGPGETVDALVQGRYFLVIENHDYVSNTLTELERVLFAWFNEDRAEKLLVGAERVTTKPKPNLHKHAAEAHEIGIAMYDLGGELIEGGLIEERISSHACLLSEHCGVRLDAWQDYFVTGAKATQRECHEMFRKIHIACLLGFHIPRVADDGTVQFLAVECPECDHEFDSLSQFGKCPECGCTG